MLRLFATFCLVWITNGQDTVTFGSYFYYINHLPFEFGAAETACANMNATLAVIDNETPYRQLVDFIENSKSRLNAYWIGLRRIRDTENFVWDDGTQLLPGSFNAWDRTEPRNAGNEDCVTMGNPCCEPNLSMYRWFDVGCTLMAFPNLVAPGFICQSSSALFVEQTSAQTTSASTTRITSAPTSLLSFSSVPLANVATSSRLSSTTAEALSPTATATIAVLGSSVAVAAVIVAIVLTRRKYKQQNKSQYSSSANNTGPPGSGLHAIYKVIEPPNEDVDEDEENGYIEANVHLKQAVPVDENGYLRIDGLSPNTTQKTDQIEESEDGYLKANVPNLLLDDHGYASVSEHQICSGVEYVNSVPTNAEYINAKSKDAKYEDVVSKSAEYINTKPQDTEYANTNSKDAANVDPEANDAKNVGAESNIIVSSLCK